MDVPLPSQENMSDSSNNIQFDRLLKNPQHREYYYYEAEDGSTYVYKTTTDHENGTLHFGGSSLTVGVGTMITIGFTMLLIFLIWGCCILYYTKNCTDIDGQREGATEEADESLKLPTKERRLRLLSYFERSGRQMVVDTTNLVVVPHCIPDEEDIEQGLRDESNTTTKLSTSATIDITLGESDTNMDDERSVILVFNKSNTQENDGQEKCCISSQGRDNTTTTVDTMDSTTSSLSLEQQPPCSSRVENDDNDESSSSARCAQHHQQQQHVSDACAICLDSYQVGDTIVWSWLSTCPHVFHRDCFVDYLASYKGKGGGSPCPSCRQRYCDETAFQPTTITTTSTHQEKFVDQEV